MYFGGRRLWTLLLLLEWSSLADDYERRPIGRMRLVRLVGVDYCQHRAAQALGSPDLLVA